MTYESEIQAPIIKGFLKAGWLAYKQDPGPMGPPSGVPDVIAFGPNGRVIQLETKTPKGSLSPAQRTIHFVLKSHGHVVLTPSSVDEGLRPIKE